MIHVIEIFIDGNMLLCTIFSAAGSLPLLSLLGARLLFNMKEAGEKGLNQGTSCRKKSTSSEINFIEPAHPTTMQSDDEAAVEVGTQGIEEIC